jgi:hypothetical protein
MTDFKLGGFVMLKKLILSAIMMGSVMMFSQNVFAFGSASVNGS